MTGQGLPPEVVMRNRELIAERCGWPPDALQACLDVEAKRPGWKVWWAPENRRPGFESPEGYHATTGNHWSEYQRVFDETPHGLLPKIDASKPPGFRA